MAERQRGRARVWREDRGIDRITGFRSRTERWQETKERAEEWGGFRVSICQIDKKQHAKPYKKKKKIHLAAAGDHFLH